MKKESPEISLRLAKEKAARGFLYQKQGKLETAIFLYQEALNLVENLEFVHYNLGIIFHYQGNLLAASTHYQQEIAYYPKQIKAHYNLAIIYQEQGLLDRAISSYQTVINLSKNNTENFVIQIQAYRSWINILIQESRYQEGIEILEQAIDLKSDDASLYNNLGQAFFHLGNIEKAIANYQHALTLNPQLIVVSYNLGKAYQQQNLHLEAIVHFQEVIKQQPENISAYSECGFSYLELGNLAGAIPYLQKTIENNDFVENYCKQTDLLVESDELQKAQIACSKFLLTLQKSDLTTVSKNLTLTYLYLGNVLFEYGEYAQAENYYKKGLKFQPLNIELYLKLGNSLAKQKRFNPAIIIYHLGLAIQPDNYSIDRALNNILAEKNNSSKKLNTDGIKRIFDLELETENLSETEKNLPTKCQGLNCQPCLKRIFKQLQPIHLGNSIHTFATSKIPTSPNSLSIDFPETPKFVTEVENGRAWIVPQKNDWMICNAIAIINQNNQLLAEVSREYPGKLPGCPKSHINNHRFFTTEKLPALEEINGTVAVLSGLSGNVYFHWMVDILPRILILRNNGINFDKIDWFLINSIQKQFQKETLRILEIPEDKIIESDKHPYIQAKKLIVPSFPGHLGWLERWGLEFHRQTFLNNFNIGLLKNGLYSGKKTNYRGNCSCPEKIYITRKKAKYRRVIDEEKVVELLGQYGFIAIELETLSVIEQVKLFANAKVIIAPHGSGLTNIMFCQSGTTVIELLSPNYIRHYYWTIGQQLGLKYYYLVGEEFPYYPIRQIMYPNPLTEDIIVNFSKLEKILSQVSIIKRSSPKKLNFVSDASTCSQKNLEDYTNKTAVTNKMVYKVDLAETAAHFHQKALFYLDQKKLDEAQAACEQAIKNQPEFAPAYKTMGIILQNQGQIKAAFDYYSQAINIQPDFAEAYVNIGTLYAKKQQWQDAINYYQKAISLSRGDLRSAPPAYRNIAKAYQKLGKVVEAANSQYQVYCLEPEKVTEIEYINLGNTLLEQKQLTEAISCYRNAIKLNPNSAVAYQNLATALSQIGDFEESNISYRKAIELGITETSKFNHNLPKKSNNLSSVNSSSPRNSARINSSNTKYQIPEKNPENNNQIITQTVNQDAVAAYKQLGKMLQQQDKPAEAWQWYTKARAITPKDPEIYRDLGSLYAQQQQWQEAIKCYQKALEINPNMADVYRYLATALTHIGKHTEASNFWEVAHSLEPETATAEEHFLLGNNLLQMNLVGAISYGMIRKSESTPTNYCNAIKINPNLTVADRNLGEALKLQSNTQNSNSHSEIPGNNHQQNSHNYILNSSSKDQSNREIKNNLIINNDSELVTEPSISPGKSKRIDRFIKNLVSQLSSVFKPKNKSSIKELQPSANLPKLEGTNNSFPLKTEIDIQIEDLEKISTKDLLFPNEKQFSNFNGNGQRKTQQQIDKTENLSSTEQIEDGEKTAIQVNAQSLNTTKSAIASPDIYIQKAIKSNQQGLYEQAIAECQQAIEVKPDLARAYKILGDIQQKMGNVEAAKQNYLKAISLNLQDAIMYANLGSIYAQEKSWEQAISYYQQAIAVKPNFAGAYRNLAKAWSQVNRQAEAADCWYQAYTLQPENITPEQYLNLGNILREQDQLTKAISCYQQVIKLKPNYTDAYHHLAATLKRQGKLDEAATYEQKAQELIKVEKKPETKIRTKQSIINPEAFLQSLSDKKRKENSPRMNQGDLIKQAEAHLRSGKFYEAIATCEEAISIKPHGVAYHIIGKAWVEMSQVDRAIAAYQKSLEMQPDAGKVYISLGELYVQQQQPEKAITAYQQAIKHAPDLKDGYRGLVEIWLEQGKVDEAENLSYQALIQHPSWATPQDFCTLGKGLIAEGKTEQGITCLRQAIKLDAKLWEAYNSLGSIFSTQQNWEEAIKYYRQAVELNAHSIESYYGLSQALTETQNWEEAIICYQKIIHFKANKIPIAYLETEENLNNIDISEIYHLLGNALAEIGKLDESVAAYQRAIELTGNIPD